MKKTYYLDGKRVNSKKEIGKLAKLARVVNEEYYETEAYTKQQFNSGMEYLARLREQREDMEKYHG